MLGSSFKGKDAVAFVESIVVGDVKAIKPGTGTLSLVGPGPHRTPPSMFARTVLVRPDPYPYTLAASALLSLAWPIGP
jgi:hypothetical protein